MEYNKLYNAIYSLYIKVHEKIILAKNNNILYCIPYERIKSQNLNFSFRTTSFQYDIDNIEYFNYYDWSADAFNSFMENEVKKLPEFEAAAEEIRTFFELSEDTKI